MPSPELKLRSRLHGVSIFLSASVPTRERRDEYDRIPEAPLQIEEAVVCIARAVFMEGGTLVFGAHPSISPLVAQVVDHYYLPAPAEGEASGDREKGDAGWQNPSVVIYQSRVWEKYWAEVTERLTRHPLVEVKWTDAVPGETIDLSVKDRSQAPLSMARMRETMIRETAPTAMIAIGGMDGVIKEAEMFRELRSGMPIFTLGTTGGAAAVLSRKPQYREHVRVMDDEAEDLVRRFWEQQEERDEPAVPGQGGRWEPGEDKRRQFYVPYGFVAQRIVAHIVENSGGGITGVAAV